MWTRGWRDRIWSQLDRPWDLIVVGGGITGAGILREAARAGLRTLLVEAHDFASGTSSRSSKMVHGGLRYLKHGEIRLTLESVRERERLLREGRGLITQLGFLFPAYPGGRPPGWLFGLGLMVYDLLALKWTHRHYDALDMRELCPPLRETALLGGYRYFDAQTDDARLVLRVLREAVRAGGTALNYAQVHSLLRDRSGRVCGVALADTAGGPERASEVRSHVVVNATGAWADSLRGQLGRRARLRQLRGSHIFLPYARLPLRRAVTFLHPSDQRPVFAFSWEGVTLFGTTDVDHDRVLATDVSLSPGEADYLLTGLRYAFPGLALGESDVRSTLAGVRPVVNTGQRDPSQESREHVLWNEAGLLTVTGGKLTTFRLMAHAALRAARRLMPHQPALRARERVLDAPPDAPLPADLQGAAALRLLGRYAGDTPALLAAAAEGELTPIAESPTLWAEVRWGAQAEGVMHLDDLLLRRVRLGLTLPEGGQPYLPRLRTIAQPELGWTDAQWEVEAARYAALWRTYHSLPA